MGGANVPGVGWCGDGGVGGVREVDSEGEEEGGVYGEAGGGDGEDGTLERRECVWVSSVIFWDERQGTDFVKVTN